jgi:hypothetical protein
MKAMLLALCPLLVYLGAPEPAPAPEHHAPLPLGTWHVRGQDTILWTAELVLFEEANAGYFEWKSERGDSGRELLTYVYDPTTSTLSLTGNKVLMARGDIAFGSYRARVADNGRRLVNGTWWGPPCSEGVWEATR